MRWSSRSSAFWISICFIRFSCIEHPCLMRWSAHFACCKFHNLPISLSSYRARRVSIAKSQSFRSRSNQPSGEGIDITRAVSLRNSCACPWFDTRKATRGGRECQFGRKYVYGLPGKSVRRTRPNRSAGTAFAHWSCSEAFAHKYRGAHATIYDRNTVLSWLGS